MIAGEYSALLPGHWALAVACTGGVVAEASRASSWRIERALHEGPWTPAHPVSDPFRFAAAAVHEMEKRGFSPCAVKTSSITTHDALGPKTGVGTSASATVAIVAACAAAQPGATGDSTPQSEVHDIAKTAHASAQGGRGSGYDIATIVTGGLVAWNAAEGRARSLPWPGSLHTALVHTGLSASTTHQIRAWETAIPSSRRRQAMTSLFTTTDAVIEAFDAQDVATILRALSATQEALLAFDDRWDLGIAPPPLRTLCDAIGETGPVARISGAGGGDSILVFADTESALDAALTVCTRSGLRIVTTALPGPSVVVERVQ